TARAAQLRQAVGDLAGIAAAGHRVVHGGASFRAAVRITAEVRQGIARLCEIDPLHTPAALPRIHRITTAPPAHPHVGALDCRLTRRPAAFSRRRRPRVLPVGWGAGAGACPAAPPRASGCFPPPAAPPSSWASTRAA